MGFFENFGRWTQIAQTIFQAPELIKQIFIFNIWINFGKVIYEGLILEN